MSKQGITATDIKLALREMHSGKPTYFLTECKTCSTYFPDPQGLLIFDGLAITKSYTKPNIIGYEIKVARNDFTRDNKWNLYLQYCNEFYFVCPKKLISKEELPDNVGLIWYDPDAKQVLRTVKRAQYRQINEPVGLYKYIIYSRLDEDRIPFYEDKAEYAKAYLQDKQIKKSIGSALGSKLSKDLEEAYAKLDRASHNLDKLDNWDKVEKLLKQYNLIGWSWWKDDGWLEDLEKALQSSYPKDLDDVLSCLEGSVKKLKRIKEQCKGSMEVTDDECKVKGRSESGGA